MGLRRSVFRESIYPEKMQGRGGCLIGGAHWQPAAARDSRMPVKRRAAVVAFIGGALATSSGPGLPTALLFCLGNKTVHQALKLLDLIENP
jgi:hypothetical protein